MIEMKNLVVELKSILDKDRELIKYKIYLKYIFFE